MVDAQLEFGRHLILFGDGLDDGLLALLNLLEFLETIADGCYLHFIESASALLAIAGDEGNGATLFEQGEGVGNSPFLKIQGTGNQFCKDILFH